MNISIQRKELPAVTGPGARQRASDSLKLNSQSIVKVRYAKFVLDFGPFTFSLALWSTKIKREFAGPPDCQSHQTTSIILSNNM
jgi:hypothetical protein